MDCDRTGPAGNGRLAKQAAFEVLSGQLRVRSTTRTTRTKRAQSRELLERSMCVASDYLFFNLSPIQFPTSGTQWNNHSEPYSQNPLPSRILLSFTSVLFQPPSAQTLARNHLMTLSYFHASQNVLLNRVVSDVGTNHNAFGRK